MRRLIPAVDTQEYKVLVPHLVAIHYRGPGAQDLITWDGRAKELTVGDMLRITHAYVHGKEPLRDVVDALCGPQRAEPPAWVLQRV